jgi:tetratricopeptide (TPR) repeat protein
VTRVGAMATSEERPYPGTPPFLETDRDRFFGRAAEAADVAELWRTNSLTILHGDSGSGKTSLLSAGVLPLVAGGKADVLPPGRVSFGVTFPDAALPPHNPYTLAVLRSWSPGEAATRLVGLSVQEFVSRRAERHSGAILAVIDQAEELLADSGPRRTHSRRFLGELAEALQECPRLHLLLSVREEALDLFAEALGNGARHSVTQLSLDRALEAVTGPVAGTGRSFAAGAAEKLIADLLPGTVATADGGVRPVDFNLVDPVLLQVVCAHLWESLPTDLTDITERAVHRYGDADTALAIHCGRVIAAVAEENNMQAARVRSWLIRTFVTEHGTRGMAYEGMADTAGMPNALARALEDRHLLSAERRSDSRWYQLLSDRLIEPLRNATDEGPAPVEAAEYLLSAERALTLGEIDLAERYARQALHALPDTDLRRSGEVRSLLGNIANERGKPGEAEAHYRAASELFEAVRDTEAVASELAAVGQTLLAQGQPADAVQELQAAADRVPHDLLVQTELGWALWELGQARAAVAVLTGVLAVDAGNPGALRARGEILADLGDARNALRDLDRVEQHDQPSTRAARGLARAELGDQGAEREIEGALADAPRNGPVLVYAARTEALGGNKVAAVELARRALSATDPAPPRHQREAAQALLGQAGNGRSRH